MSGLRIGFCAAAIWAAVSWASAAEAPGQAEFRGCRARWSATELVLGNAHFERKWNVRGGALTASSFRDLDAGIEWIARPADAPAPRGAAKPAAGAELAFAAHNGRSGPAGEEALIVEATAPGAHGTFLVFPAARGALVSWDAEGDAAPAASARASAAAGPSGIETDGAAAGAGPEPGDALEDFELAPPNLRFTAVTLVDQTDNHNELVFENEWLLMPNEAPLKLPGNVFFVEDPLTRAGLVFLKLAPLPHARPVKSGWDALVTPGKRRVRLSGGGYSAVALAYAGGRAGRIGALQDFQRQLRPYDPARDGLFLSNTWGDRSRDARINEEFILREIEAGAKLGVDVVQVDDGWQKGRTANSAAAKGKGVWNGYWAADPDFWQPDPVRFPRGLAPVVAAARAHGMKFGLWFGPDSSHEAANWQRDADRLLELHARDGIDYFKIDSVKATTRLTEQNLHRFFDRVLEKSGGKVVFDLDVTAEIRPGYFGAADVGPIFLENRYTDFHRYWPHQTLRNLWKLAQYVDPLRLRMELLNNTRHPELYAGDPLAPALYPPDTLFAVAMCANPLGWFETSNLPAPYVAAVAPLVATWKRERARMFAGRMLPVGAAPDGASWTGFASLGADGGAYALVFRELSAQADWTLELPLPAAAARRVTLLAGQGSAEWKDGRLAIKIPETLRYLWVRVE